MIRGICYKTGVVLSFLGVSGLADAITGRGSHMASVSFIAIGIILCLFGYVK